MSYTRGQETFWNRLTITVQNLYRLAVLCSLFWLMTTGTAFYFIAPSSFWQKIKQAFYWFGSLIKAEGFFVAFGRVERFYALISKTLVMHQNEIMFSAIIGLIAAVFVFVAALIYFNSRGQEIANDAYVSGARLVNDREFNSQAKKLIRNQKREIARDTKNRFKRRKELPAFCSTADKIKIPCELLSNHMAAIGATGTGKTTVIKHRIEHAKSIGSKGIVLDVNGEIYSQVGGKNDVILSLFDKRAAFWDYKHEHAASVSIRPLQIAEYLIPSSNAGEPIWWKGPRIILEDLLSQCHSTAELWELIQNPSADLIKFLATGLAKKTAGKPDSKTAFSMVISTILDCRYFGFLNHWPTKFGRTKPFSILDWTQNTDSKWIFIMADEKDVTVMQPLMRLWFNIAIHGILTRKPYSNLPPICVIIDEMRSIGKLDLLPSAINRMRKYGGQGFFGYQSDYQLQHLYGSHDASAINSGIGTKFIFNITNEREAEAMARSFGMQEVKRKSLSMTYGVTAHGDRETLGEQIFNKPVVTPTDIAKLPNGHCYIKARAIDPVKTRIKYKDWPEKLPLHAQFHEYPDIEASPQIAISASHIDSNSSEKARKESDDLLPEDVIFHA